jgi:hypothetical protein
MTTGTPITIRLTGGIAGHLLGMRALALAHARFPGRPIVVYSEGASHIAALSPFVSKVIATAPADGVTITIDASGDDLFAKAAIALRMPLFEFLAVRPMLQMPEWAVADADRILHDLRVRRDASSFVGVCFASEEAETLTRFQPRILGAIRSALDAEPAVGAEVIALNFFMTQAQSHESLAGLSALDSRIVPCADLPIEVVASLLTRCRYFVGGDNGIKQLAWALDVPRTFFVKAAPPRLDILRWMPDVHRMLQFPP